MKKTRFASLLVLCAIIAAVAFYAGRATVKMDETMRPTAELAASGAPSGSLQTVPEKHDSHGAESASQPAAPSQKSKGKGKILYWRAPMDPTYISDKPGKSPMGMDLVPVYEDKAPPSQPAEPSQKPKGKGKILYWRAPMDPTYISDKPGKSPMGMDLVPVYEDEASPSQPAAPSQKSKGKGKILYWRAPMDPNYISDKPGKSPMGMDLVPVYEDEVSTGEVRISPSVVQEIGVTTVEATSGPFSKTIRTYGTSTWNETTLAALNTKIDGWIEKLNVNETGQLVRKGQPLIEIYSPQLVSAQQEYLSALDNAGVLEDSSSRLLAQAAVRLPEAARMRLKLWDISDAQTAELRKTRKIRKTLTLYAPISGIVTDRNVVAGDYVKAGINLVKIAALDPIWVMGSIYEDEISMVKKGMKATIAFDTLPGESFAGTVDYVYPYVEGKSRTSRVRVILPNPKGRILPQMYGTVNLRVSVAEKAVQIPGNAVIRASSTDNLVFIALGEGRFAGRQVILGPEGDDGKVMVKGGLAAGERVVTSAQFLLDSESQLRAAVQSMLSHGGHSE